MQQKYNHVKSGPSGPVMLSSPCMGDGSIDNDHCPSTPISSMYHEASSQHPWIADQKSGCFPCIYGDKQNDQSVQ